MEMGRNNMPEIYSNRACDACRLHKVRCLLNTSTASFSDLKSCLRCLRTDRQCVFTAPQKRKQRKRTDIRVVELEREVQAMRSLFDKKKDLMSQGLGEGGVPALTSNLSFSPVTKVDTYNISMEAPDTSKPDFSSFPIQQHWSPSIFNSNMDIFEKGILSWETAETLFHTFVNDLFKHYPVVYFQPGSSAKEVQRTKPTLFLAVITAAAAKTDPHLFSTLHSEVVADYAHRTVMNNEKSLELVQAQIVISVWYYPPGNYSQLKFYEYIHMAASMAMDIGIGTNPKFSRKRYGGIQKKFSPGSEVDAIKDEAELERRRTFLVCYLIATTVAASMRRPNMIRSNSWVNDCIGYLTVRVDLNHSDETLLAWVTLLQITEEVVTSFSFDDPECIANLAEPHVALMLNGFEHKLQHWRERFQSDCPSDTLLLAYHYTQIYVHEIALHDDHPPEDILPPYKLEKIISIEENIQASSSYIKPITIIVSSTHSLFDVLLSMDVETLRAIPINNFVRMTYAFIILTKLHISSKKPDSQIGSILDPYTLKLAFYLESIITKLSAAVGEMECRAPFTFLGLLVRLRFWYKTQENEEHFKKPTGLKNILESCWLPPPPKTNKTLTSTAALRLPDNSLDFQAQEMGSMGHYQMVDPLEPVTMQPLPKLNFDWVNPQVNQFLELGNTRSYSYYDDWMPGVEETVLNKTPENNGWESAQGDNSML